MLYCQIEKTTKFLKEKRLFEVIKFEAARTWERTTLVDKDLDLDLLGTQV